jgi:CRISPR-associated protein Csm2
MSSKSHHSHKKEDQRSSDNNWKKQKNKVPQWVKSGLDRESVTFANELGQHLADPRDGLSTSQIRNVFGEIRRIQAETNSPKDFAQKNRTAIAMLRPKLAYAVKRDGKKRSQDFNEIFDEAVATVQESENENSDEFYNRFQNFVMLIESIIAYHKFHGGKE